MLVLSCRFLYHLACALVSIPGHRADLAVLVVVTFRISSHSTVYSCTMRYSSVAAIATCLVAVDAFEFLPGPKIHRPGSNKVAQITKRQLPAQPVGIQSITSPSGVNITYKDPGAEGICETTAGVNSYAGFVNLAPDVHSFVIIFLRPTESLTD